MNNLFWGIFILLVGLSIIVKSLFGFSLPIVRPLIGAFLIYLGIMMIINLRDEKHFSGWGDAHFKDTHPARHYSVMFGKGTIDLSSMAIPEKPISVKMNTVFGQSDITLNKRVPTRIRLNSFAAETTLPYNDMEQTGSNDYQMGADTPLLNLEINVIFGKSIVTAR